MSIRKIEGLGWYWPDIHIPVPLGTATYTTTILLDATGEKAAFVGRVFFPERTGTKSIRRVHLHFGAMTRIAGSGLELSLQGLNAVANPGVPDGVKGQTVAIPMTSIAQNLWFRSEPLNADRVVTYNQSLAVVVEYDAAGRLGSDSIVINNLTGSSHPSLDSYPLLYTASWVVQAQVMNMMLEFSDGTYGTLGGSVPWISFANYSYHGNTVGADEYALRFTVPCGCTVDALIVAVRALSLNADFEVILYDGTTPLATAPVDVSSLSGLVQNFLVLAVPEVRLYTGKTYYLSVRPVTVNSVVVYSADVYDAAVWKMLPGDDTCTFATRVDSGAWSAPTTTRRLQAAVRISGVEVGGAQQMASVV